MKVTVNSSAHFQGPANAPITLVEYGDYQCPYCRQAHYIIINLQKHLGDKLRFVFRNFPLEDLHPNALHAAIAVETAALEGKFWEMHEILFENQRRLDDASLVNYAREIGLDAVKFEHNFGGNLTVKKVEADLESGNEAGVDGTPYFFVNGVLFEGNWTNNEFLEYLEQQL